MKELKRGRWKGKGQKVTNRRKRGILKRSLIASPMEFIKMDKVCYMNSLLKVEWENEKNGKVLDLMVFTIFLNA